MPNSTDTQVPELIINTLTKEQYDTLNQNNQIDDNQLYLTKDEDYFLVNSVIYGTTTYAQITAMLNNKEIPVCDYNGFRYNYAGLDSGYYYFTCVVNGHVKTIKVDTNNTWSNNDIMLPTVTIIDWSE